MSVIRQRASATTRSNAPLKPRVKVAFICPFPDSPDIYPQVSVVGEALRAKFDVEWLTISERGNWPEDTLSNTVFSGDLRGSLRLAAKIGRDWWAVRRAARKAEVVFALDFMALLLARSVSRRPVVYWSLEVIAKDEPRYSRKVIRLWLALVRNAVSKDRLIVIQGEERLDAFERSLGLPTGRMRPFFLPVSMPAPCHLPQSSPWVGKPHVMQIGGLNASRSRTDFLLAQFASARGAFDLSLHGTVHPDIASELDSVGSAVRQTAAQLPYDEIPRIVSQCSVGFIGNVRPDENFRLLKNACGQLVEFLRCGKPVISMGPNDLGRHLEAHGAGFQVNNPSEFVFALAAIHADYETYSANATRLYRAQYDFDIYSSGLCQFLEEAAGKRQ